MPIISMFYGIIVRMFFLDNKRHKKPHIHASFQEHEIVLSLPDGRLIEGKFPGNKLKLLHAWVEIHRDELMADWDLASNGEAVFKIDPLK
jgi:hypothetical protein